MVDGFQKAFEKYVSFHKNEILKQRTLAVDAIVDFDISNDQLALIDYGFSIFQPFGEGNPEPIILIKNFLWERDHYFLPLKIKPNELESNDKFDLVVSYYGNYATIIDFKKVEN